MSAHLASADVKMPQSVTSDDGPCAPPAPLVIVGCGAAGVEVVARLRRYIPARPLVHAVTGSEPAIRRAFERSYDPLVALGAGAGSARRLVVFAPAPLLEEACKIAAVARDDHGVDERTLILLANGPELPPELHHLPPGSFKSVVILTRRTARAGRLRERDLFAAAAALGALLSSPQGLAIRAPLVDPGGIFVAGVARLHLRRRARRRAWARFGEEAVAEVRLALSAWRAEAEAAQPDLRRRRDAAASAQRRANIEAWEERFRPPESAPLPPEDPGIPWTAAILTAGLSAGAAGVGIACAAPWVAATAAATLLALGAAGTTLAWRSRRRAFDSAMEWWLARPERKPRGRAEARLEEAEQAHEQLRERRAALGVLAARCAERIAALERRWPSSASDSACGGRGASLVRSCIASLPSRDPRELLRAALDRLIAEEMDRARRSIEEDARCEASELVATPAHAAPSCAISIVRLGEGQPAESVVAVDLRAMSDVSDPGAATDGAS